MTWESALFCKTRLAAHSHCLALLQSYAGNAPVWERCCLAAYVALGPAVARCLGADTTEMWKNAESVAADIMATSGLSPLEVIELLRKYVRLKLDGKHHLPFEQARAEIYDQPFYPIVTHFTFALQPSAMARLRFVREIAAAMTDGPADVADLGCGSGLVLTEVLLMKPSWTGHGLDVSSTCVDYARRLAAHKCVEDRAEFLAEDITLLPYPDESLDLVIVSEVMEHVRESDLVLMGIARALRPGGQLAVTIPLESHTPAHLRTFHDPGELLSPCEKAGFNVRRIKPQWHFGFGDDRRHLFVLMEKPADPAFDTAGLEDITEEAVECAAG